MQGSGQLWYNLLVLKAYGILAENLSYVDVVPDSVKKNIIAGWLISPTPDQDFFGFTYEIILSHIPVPVHGKDKKLTAANQPHTGGKSICDVIVMLK